MEYRFAFIFILFCICLDMLKCKTGYSWSMERYVQKKSKRRNWGKVLVAVVVLKGKTQNRVEVCSPTVFLRQSSGPWVLALSARAGSRQTMIFWRWSGTRAALGRPLERLQSPPKSDCCEDSCPRLPGSVLIWSVLPALHFWCLRVHFIKIRVFRTAL